MICDHLEHQIKHKSASISFPFIQNYAILISLLPTPNSSERVSRDTVAKIMLVRLMLATSLLLAALAIALLPTMLLRRMVVLVGMWLSLDCNSEVLSSIRNSVNKDLISIWPFSLEVLLLIVLCKRLLFNFFVQQSYLCGCKCFLAS